MNEERNVKIPKAFDFLLKEKARYKACHGGRGSGKSHSFASSLLLKASEEPLRILCCREIQKSIKDSSKRLLDDKIEEYGLRWFFQSTETEIRGQNGSLFIFAGLRSNPESIKSMEGVDIAWVEEADKVSQRSLDLLIPTIRKPDSEIWFSWNRFSELDPVDKLFSGENVPPDSIIRHVNYTENPFCPQVLIDEAEYLKQTDPEKYEHVWLGGYQTVGEFSYYARTISKAQADGRITNVPYDPTCPVYASFDIGISDATAIWLYQIVGREIRFIEYFESSGENITYYAQELKKKGYIYAPLVLPHDARARELGTGKSIEEILVSLGFQTFVCPQIPVRDGIEAVRRVIGKAWFDADGCREGLRFLRSYRENFDDKLRISRGPLHDDSSHCADSMRYAAVSMNEAPKPQNSTSIMRQVLYDVARSGYKSA